MIYFVRHGQTNWNITKRIQGQVDIPLNENGREQARNISEEIANLKIDKIISSDLSRAKETAEIINQRMQKKLIIDERLREINYGLIEGTRRLDLSEKTWKIYDTEPEKLHAESKKDVYERIKSFFEEIHSSNNDENILVVTHGGILRMVMYYSKYREEYNYEKYKELIDNISIKNAQIIAWEGSIEIQKEEEEEER